MVTAMKENLPLTPLPEPVTRIPYSLARQSGVAVAQGTLLYRQGISLDMLLEARRLAGICPTLLPLEEAAFDEQLSAIYQHNAVESQQIAQDLDQDIDLFALTEELPDNEDLLADDNSAPVIRLINAILSEAVKEGASDIHIETFERSLSIRFRIDGVLRQILRPSKKLAPLLLSRIKVMAKLDIAEKRLPQDGRISLRLGSRAVDVRVSTLPSQHGERAVLRLLDKNNLLLTLDKLGLSACDYEKLQHLIKQPHGILLVTGPTGSGKSTTLYAVLSALNSQERNILTVEDPIEYELEGIGQTQVNSRLDMTFARGLRAILRQDPDIVMVGEIRDGETAQIAVQASLTGHLVMSTLHTNSATGAVTRLRDMGIESFLLSSSLIGVLAQRLVRRLCPECRQPQAAGPHQRALLTSLSPIPDTLWHAPGCPACRYTGYKGRLAIHEVMVVDEAIRAAIHGNENEQVIKGLFLRQSKSLLENGLLKAVAGETSLEEVMRVTSQEQDVHEDEIE